MKILVVDQDPEVVEQVGDYLERNDKPLKLDTSPSVEEALRLFQNNEYAAIISEYDFPGKNGLDFLKVVRKQDEFTPFLLFTDKRERKLAEKTLKLGANHYLLKEGDLRIDESLLAEILLQEIEHQRMRETVREHKKLREQALRESETKYRTMFESANDAIFIMDKETFVDCNQKTLEMFDCTREEIIGQPPYEFSPPQQPDGRDSKEKVLEKINAALEGEPQFFDWAHTKADGTPFFAEVSLNRLELDEEQYILAIVRDVTDHREIEEKLEVLHEWAQRLNVAETLDEIYGHTLNAMDKALGFERIAIEIKKGGYITIVKSKSYDIPFPERELPLDGKGLVVKATNLGTTILANDVSKHPDYLSTSPTIQSELVVPIKIDEKVLGVLNVESTEKNSFDQHDKRLLEILASHTAVAINEVQEKKRRVSLQKLDELRNRFLAMAAHEIKTPLTPIKTRLEMLREGYFDDLTKSQEREIANLLKSVDRLNRLVEDFRRITQLRPDRVRLKKGEHQLANTIAKVMVSYKDMIQEEGISVIKHITESLTASYDEEKLIQVIQNLLENAIDYTDDKIWIKAGETKGMVWIEVRDNGQGIPKEEQEKIFEPFYRSEPERSRNDRRFGGSGLGLNICKRIIKAHDGRIEVESTIGTGTTFTIMIPTD